MQTMGTVPTPAMLNGDFSFPEAAAQAAACPYTIRSRPAVRQYLDSRTPLPGNIVPQSMFDPVAVKYLALGIWQQAEPAGHPDQDRPTNNLLLLRACSVPAPGPMGRED